MSIPAAARDPRVADANAGDTGLTVLLRDGRKISAPLDWFPRLRSARPERRKVWELAAAGHGIHWPLIDEDLSVEGLLQAGN